MTSKEFDSLKIEVIDRLHNKLSEHLYYHCPQHTERVLKAAVFIAKKEKIKGHDLLLIKLAALYHDYGFVNTYANHEEEGCRIAAEELKVMGFNSSDIQKICGMIMATKIPQQAHNILEQVVADADLEYLGTKDFDHISKKLYLELLYRNPELTIENWNKIQVDFMENHRYFTDYAKKNLEEKKREHSDKLKI
ncbi:MAG: HD domain-containing protein [Saprospiraceae bacterium]|jgi:uncharacterized protein|nr:HD domain-containing protein [Saprospiraceae bacterium]